MPKNKVQFQRGTSLHEFVTRYGSREQCEQALFAWRWPQGFVCPGCGHRGCCALKKRPLFQCSACAWQSSVTAGTVFAGSKLALSVWFLAIHLITQAKNGISSLALARELGISHNSAWLMKHKLMRLRVNSAAWCRSTTPTGAAGAAATSAGAARAARPRSWQRCKSMPPDSRSR